jgi:Uma2 family endonuclease
VARLTVHRYFEEPESSRPMELIYGVVREPPAPFLRHQGVVTRLASALNEHVRRDGLGDVYVSPVDVVLDEARALVLQPDIIFIAAARRHIARDRVWGAPDLVVEVLSPGTARRDRTRKLAWYRQYGVKECWLVDPLRRRVDVVACDVPRSRRVFAGSTPIRSRVLPALDLQGGEVFQSGSSD